MPEALTPFEAGTEENQALRFYARRRRESLAGLARMHRTHRIFGGTVMGVDPIVTVDVFPDRTTPVTFRTVVRTVAGAGNHSGRIFQIGTDPKVFLFFNNTLIGATAGAVGTGDGTPLGMWTVPGGIPDDWEVELVTAVNPGNGKMRIWANGQSVIAVQAANESFNGPWSDANDGVFVAPELNRVEVIEPLSVYVGQLPRHFEFQA